MGVWVRLGSAGLVIRTFTCEPSCWPKEHVLLYLTLFLSQMPSTLSLSFLTYKMELLGGSDETGTVTGPLDCGVCPNAIVFICA